MKKIISVILSNGWLLYFIILSFYFNILKKYFNLFERQKVKFIKTYPLMGPVVDALEHFYLQVSPYSVSTVGRKDKGLMENKNFTYGETLMSSIPKILEGIDISETDVFYELGSGTGYISFFVNQYTPAKKVIGIDIIKGFIDISKIVVKNLKLKNIYFYEGDYFTKKIDEGTIFYITATCYDQKDMDRFEEKLDTLPAGIRVITITRPLYSPKYKLLSHKISMFTWSFDQIFYYEKVE